MSSDKKIPLKEEKQEPVSQSVDSDQEAYRFRLQRVYSFALWFLAGILLGGLVVLIAGGTLPLIWSFATLGTLVALIVLRWISR